MFSNSNQFATYNLQQTHIIEDLIKDRRRDMQNLSLLNDLIDVRNFGQDVFSSHSTRAPANFGLQSHTENMAIDNTIKVILLDTKYNRRADEVIANLALGRPHLERVDEQWQDLGDLTRDLKVRQTAKEVMARKAMRVLETPRLSSMIDCHQAVFPQFEQAPRLSSLINCQQTMIPQLNVNSCISDQGQFFNYVPQISLANSWGSSGQVSCSAPLINKLAYLKNISSSHRPQVCENVWGSSLYDKDCDWNTYPQMNKLGYLNNITSSPRIQFFENVCGWY
jgi:hypothetical protein